MRIEGNKVNSFPAALLVAAGLLVAQNALAMNEALCTLEVTKEAKAEDDSAPVTQLFSLMRERFDLLEQIAAYKWENKVPIEDLVQEKKVLEEIQADATKVGLDSAFAESFAKSQFNAAKQVQKNYFKKWEAAGLHGFDQTPDLAKELRPRLAKLRTPMLTELVKVHRIVDRPGMRDAINARAKERLSGDVVDEDVLKMVLEPFQNTLPKPSMRESKR